MNLILSKQQRRPPLSDRRLFLRTLRAAAGLCGLAETFSNRPRGHIHVVIVAGERMAELNEAFLGHSGPTDVLSFDLSEHMVLPTDEPDVVGEVYICLDVAISAAAEYETTLGDELVLYAVHGMLHLAGHEDGEEIARRRMREEERRVMQALREKFDLRAIFADPGGTSSSRSAGCQR